MYQVPRVAAARGAIVRCLMPGIIGLMSVLFIVAYSHFFWPCTACGDPRIPRLIDAAQPLGVIAFIGSIVCWDQLGARTRLAGVVLPPLLALIWGGTAVIIWLSPPF